MKILITGATGFLGSHLLDRLTGKSELKDHIVYANFRSQKKIPEHASTDIIWLKGDVDDLSFIDKIDQLDCVIHTAGIVHSYDKQDFFNTNAEGTKKLVLKLKERFPALHFVLISSLAAKGPREAQGPISDYGRSKLKAEQYLNELAPNEWATSIVRPPMIMGPRDTAVLDIFKMVQGGVVLRGGNSKQPPKYSISCVYDLVDLIELLIVNKRSGIFYGHYPEIYNFNELIKAISNQFEKSVKTIVLPNGVLRFASSTLAKMNKVISMNARLTPDKVNEILALEWVAPNESVEGFNPQFDLEKTVAITFKDYLDKGQIKK
jgi:nucleoside-diphosphate-sugar epimerase